MKNWCPAVLSLYVCQTSFPSNLYFRHGNQTLCSAWRCTIAGLYIRPRTQAWMDTWLGRHYWQRIHWVGVLWRLYSSWLWGHIHRGQTFETAYTLQFQLWSAKRTGWNSFMYFSHLKTSNKLESGQLFKALLKYGSQCWNLQAQSMHSHIHHGLS